MVAPTRSLARRLATSAATLASAVVLFAGAPGQVATTASPGELVGLWHDTPIFTPTDAYTFLALLSEGRFAFSDCRDYTPDCRMEESSGSWHLESGEIVLEIKKKLEIKGGVGPADPKWYLDRRTETCVYSDEPPRVEDVSPAEEKRLTYHLFEDSQVGLLSMKLDGTQYWRVPDSIDSYCDYFFMKPRECAPKPAAEGSSPP